LKTQQQEVFYLLLSSFVKNKAQLLQQYIATKYLLQEKEVKSKIQEAACLY